MTSTSLTLTGIEFHYSALDLAYQPLDSPEQVDIGFTSALATLWGLLENHLEQSSAEEADGLEQIGEGTSLLKGILSMLDPDDASFGEKFGIVARVGDVLEHQPHEPSAEISLAFPFGLVVAGKPSLFAQVLPRLCNSVVGPGRCSSSWNAAVLVFDHEAVEVRGEKTAVASRGDKHIDVTAVGPTAKSGRMDSKSLARLFECEPLKMGQRTFWHGSVAPALLPYRQDIVRFHHDGS